MEKPCFALLAAITSPHPNFRDLSQLILPFCPALSCPALPCPVRAERRRYWERKVQSDNSRHKCRYFAFLFLTETFVNSGPSPVESGRDGWRISSRLLLVLLLLFYSSSSSSTTVVVIVHFLYTLALLIEHFSTHSPLPTVSHNLSPSISFPL